MAFKRKQKQKLVAAVHPLTSAGIVQPVFSFLPGYHWHLYRGMEEQQVLVLSLDASRGSVKCGFGITLYNAAVASPATARSARSCGLALSTNKSLQLTAGLHADMQTLATLRELGMPLSNALVNAAALSGRLHILQHLITVPVSECPRRTTMINYQAARSGSISMLNWLRAQSWCTFDALTCAGAALGAHLAALQHLNIGCNWNDKILCYAACGGSIAVVDWLLQQQGVGLTAEATVAAADGGHIAVCKHLRSVGCEWNTDACSQAAAGSHIEVLAWLREHGCPWDMSEVFIAAAGYGHTSILDYIVQQGEVLSAELLTDALNHADLRNKLAVAQW
jgi:hypothetical protein